MKRGDRKTKFEFGYQVSEFLCRELHQADDESAWFIALEEHEAWSLREFWEEEGPLACGSDALNAKLAAFIDSIV